MKPLAILDKNAFFPKTLSQTFQQHSTGFALGRCKSVVHPQSFLAGHDESGLAKICQMPGYGGLRTIQYIYDVADTQFAALKQIENPQAGPVGKCPKDCLRVLCGDFGFHIRLCKYSCQYQDGQ
jgi:hypothetical protein